MIVIDPKSTKTVLVVIALAVGAPVALISVGRHQGWAMHRDCLEQALSRQPEPEIPGSTNLFRQALGAGPAPDLTPGQFAAQLLESCQELP